MGYLHYIIDHLLTFFNNFYRRNTICTRTELRYINTTNKHRFNKIVIDQIVIDVLFTIAGIYVI